MWPPPAGVKGREGTEGISILYIYSEGSKGGM